MQPYLFPYLGYFSLLAHVDEYVVLDDVQMITRGWINRNNILLAGEPHRFTVSLVNSSQSRLISEVEVGDDFRRFRKLLASAYAKASHFLPTMNVIDEIVGFPDRNLAVFIENAIRILARHLDIGTPIVRSSSIPITPGLRAQDKIIALCGARHANGYVNPVGGMTLYHGADFANRGIDLKFLRYVPVPYEQNVPTFVPNLSVIDALMFKGATDTRALLDHYELLADPSGRP